jgi:hypothetical protein
LSYLSTLPTSQLTEGFTTTANNDLLESLAGALQKISNTSDQPNLNPVNPDDKKDSTGGWDKIPEIIQSMILKLSSTNDSAFAPGPTDSYLQVLKQNKALGAAMILNVLLSTMGCQVEITTSMANTIKTGNFRANSLQIAHPFSVFNVPYIDAAQMSCFNQTELDLLQSEGEGIPKEIVKKLSENKFKAPKNTHHLRHQFNNWYGILQICFGPQALLSLETKEWINHIDKHEASYDTCFKSDNDFGAKVLGLVDLTFYQFCDSCLKSKTPDDLDYSIISLHSKRFDIIQNCFQANKPAYLVAPKPIQVDSDDEGKERESRKKKPKLEKDKDYQNKDLGSLVKNPNPIKEWIISKNYRHIFNRHVNRLTPPFNDSGLIACNKWHLQGYCFEKCDRKASHKDFTSDSHKSAYLKWVKETKEKSPHKSS